MGNFTRAEVEEAIENYTRVVEGCSASGDWRPFADLFTEDVVYTEHHYGIFNGREAVRDWIVAVMAPFPHMRFPNEWMAYDEDNDAVVVMIKNLLDHPTDPNGEPFWFPNWTRLVYAGDGLFSSEEDIYNPNRDAPGVVTAWLEARGALASDDILQANAKRPDAAALTRPRRRDRTAANAWSHASNVAAFRLAGVALSRD